MRKLLIPLIAILGASVSGCSTLTNLENVASDWSCPLVDGVCADISTIDASLILNGSSPANAVGAPGGSLSQGYEAIAISYDGGDMPERSTDEVARIVFAPSIDRAGNFHGERELFAVMRDSLWAPTEEGTSGDPYSTPTHVRSVERIESADRSIALSKAQGAIEQPTILQKAAKTVEVAPTAAPVPAAPAIPVEAASIAAKAGHPNQRETLVSAPILAPVTADQIELQKHVDDLIEKSLMARPDSEVADKASEQVQSATILQTEPAKAEQQDAADLDTNGTQNVAAYIMSKRIPIITAAEYEFQLEERRALARQKSLQAKTNVTPETQIGAASGSNRAQ